MTLPNLGGIVPKIGAIVLIIGTVALLTRACGPTPDPSKPVHFVADPLVPDLAMAFPERGEIRVNLPLLANVPPNFASFIFLHESAHIALGHESSISEEERRKQELEADCWASRHATTEERMAARTFFAGIGPMGSGDHPSGFDRAAKIMECAP